MLKVRYASLPNLVLDREVQPEFLQENCRADRLAPAVAGFLSDRELRRRQTRDLDLVVAALSGAGTGAPSRQAARAVLQVVAETGRS